MNNFETLPEWDKTHKKLANLTAKAAEEMLSWYLPAQIYTGLASELLANRAIRKHCKKTPGHAYFIANLSEISNATKLLTRALRKNATLKDVRKKREWAQEISIGLTVHQRRLVEILCSLILFSRLPGSASLYIEHFELLRRYDLLQKKWSSFYTYFGTSQFRTDTSFDLALSEILKQIQTNESDPNFVFQDAWYLKSRSRKPLVPTPQEKFPSIFGNFSSTASDLKSIIETSVSSGQESLEKAALGLTYQSIYGETSNSIHFSSNNADEVFLTGREFQQAIVTINILAATAICKCFELSSSQNQFPLCKRLRKKIVGPIAHDLYSSVVTIKGKQGDFLTALIYDDQITGRIANVYQNSKTNYISYEVKPFTTQKLPHKNVLVPAMDVLNYFQCSQLPALAKKLRKSFKIKPNYSNEEVIALAANQGYEQFVQCAQQFGNVSTGARRKIFQLSR